MANTPYDSVRKMISDDMLPSYVLKELDQLRVASYEKYDDIYWNVPDAFKLTQRGKNENPVYIPSGRIICNTMDRYLGNDWAVMPDPDEAITDELKAKQMEFMLWIRNFFRREKMGSTYEANKLFGIIRGDWCFYITGNPQKPQGSRLSLKGIHPKRVFPITDPNDIDRELGVDIIEQFSRGDEVMVRRTRYLKGDHPEHPSGGEAIGGPISYQVEEFTEENWVSDTPRGIFTQPLTLMPTSITSVPVYRIKNFEEPGNMYGSSEMRGLERVMAAVNQSISDQELTLALHGIGMYKSDKGQPVNPVTGQPTNWSLGPGKVIHDESFERVSGVTSVSPYLDHIQYMEDRMARVNGVSDVAQGVVDVSVAESGIALKMRMAPIISTATKKEKAVGETLDQMMFDLRLWIKEYEGLDFTNFTVYSTFGDKLPRNVDEEFNRLLSMYNSDPPLITASYLRDACREMGINIPADMTGLDIAEERRQMAEVMDPYAERLDDTGNEPEVEELTSEE